MKTATMTRPLVGALAVGAAVSSLLLVPGAAHGTTAAATSHTYFGGQAYGSIVGLSSLAKSGKTAYVPMCTSEIGAEKVDKTAGMTIPGLGTIGAVSNRMASAGHHSGTSSTGVSNTAGVSLLAGLIHADALTATAREFKSKSGKYTATGSASLLNLSILGQKLPSTTKPNQTFALPGLGSVVLNQTSTSNRDGNHTIKVTALRLSLNPGNTLGLPSGSVTIGHAMASMHDPAMHEAYGSAYGTTASALNVVKSGKTAPVSQGCGGTSGKTVGNSTASVTIPSVLQTGATGSTTGSVEHGKSMTAASSSRIAHVNLLGGVVQVGVLVAKAAVTRTGTHLTRSDAGTSFVDLTINGKSFAAPSTDMVETIPGLATLYFNHAASTHTGMQVTALRVVLLKAVGGLAAGAQVTLGSATAGVKP